MINRIKMRIFLGILFSCFFSQILAQKSTLAEGDSLFNQQKYTEAYEKYESVYKTEKASSSMLLKMAFIHDGLGNYTEALFFLDKYYRMSADRLVVGKIEELAESNDLSGYKYTDIDYFLALLEKYKVYIMFLLASTTLLLLVYILRKTKGEEIPYAAAIIQFIVAIGLVVVVNVTPAPRAIVVSDQTLVRTGPSAGADPVEMIAKGHKVKILKQDEVWTQIVWDGREVFVRNGKLRII